MDMAYTRSSARSSRSMLRSVRLLARPSLNQARPYYSCRSSTGVDSSLAQSWPQSDQKPQQENSAGQIWLGKDPAPAIHLSHEKVTIMAQCAQFMGCVRVQMTFS
jgi:hypothetical protein